MRSGISNQQIRSAENLLYATTHAQDPQVRLARSEVEQALYALRQRIQDYERLRSQAHGIGCLSCS